MASAKPSPGSLTGSLALAAPGPQRFQEVPAQALPGPGPTDRTQDASLPAGQRLPRRAWPGCGAWERQGTQGQEAVSRAAGLGQVGEPAQLREGSLEARRRRPYVDGDTFPARLVWPLLVRLKTSLGPKAEVQRPATGG